MPAAAARPSSELAHHRQRVLYHGGDALFRAEPTCCCSQRHLGITAPVAFAPLTRPSQGGPGRGRCDGTGRVCHHRCCGSDHARPTMGCGASRLQPEYRDYSELRPALRTGDVILFTPRSENVERTRGDDAWEHCGVVLRIAAYDLLLLVYPAAEFAGRKARSQHAPACTQSARPTAHSVMLPRVCVCVDSELATMRCGKRCMRLTYRSSPRVDGTIVWRSGSWRAARCRPRRWLCCWTSGGKDSASRIRRAPCRSYRCGRRAPGRACRRLSR